MTSASTSSEIPGARAIVESLEKCHVEMIFGYQGGGVGYLSDEIARFERIPHINGRTEITSAWMSYGYNRIKRRAASACVFHCVGMIHTAPVVYAAKSDSTPLFEMDVNLDSNLNLREALQEGNEIYSVLKPISKYIRRLETPEDIPLAIRQAVISASSGRPGPSVLDIPYNVTTEKAIYRIEDLVLPTPPAGHNDAISTAVDMILKAKNPVIFSGGGAQLSGASAEVQQLAESLCIPVVTTLWGGKGIIAETHPLNMGCSGSFGWICANETLQHADLWITLGVSFTQGDTAVWTIKKPDNVIQIDIDPWEIGKIFQPTVGIIGDARTVLGQIIEKLRGRLPDTSYKQNPKLKDLEAQKQAWFQRVESMTSEKDKPINQYFTMKKFSEILPPGTIVVSDSGTHANFLHRSFIFRVPTPRAAGGRYESLGMGLPVAMGAKLAAPERPVLCYHGDGGFFYNFTEFATIASNKIKLIIAIEDNGYLVSNKMGQDMNYNHRYTWTVVPRVDWVAVAKAFGLDGEMVTEPEELGPALKRAINSDVSYVLDIVTDPETRVKRAIPGVIPVISDRPSKSMTAHFSPGLESTWPT